MLTSSSSSNAHNPDWTLLIRTLLSSGTDQTLPIEVAECGSELVITTTDVSLLQRMELILRSPLTIRQALAYTIDTDTSAVEPDYPQLVFPEKMENTFNHLFHADVIKRLGEFKWKNLESTTNEQLIYFPCADLEGLTTLQLEGYKKILRKATLEQCMRAATANSEHVPLQFLSSSAEISDGVLAENLNNILYITHDKSDRAILCFDAKTFMDCLRAPKLLYSNVNSVESGVGNTFDENVETFVCAVDKNHLMSYLSTRIREGFILHLKQPTADGRYRAQPICFNMDRALPLANVISLVLDTSSSMKSCFAEYIDNIVGFINKLRNDENYRNTQVRIKSFSYTTEEAKIFELGSEELITYLRSLEYGGKTYLNGAVQEELVALAPMLEDKNVILLVFTDGADNASPAEALVQLEQQMRTISENGTPPKILTFGLKSLKAYDIENLERLAVASGYSHVELQTISEFSPALQSQIGEYYTSVRVLRFVQSEENIQFSTRVQQGHTTVAKQSFMIPGTVEVNGQKYVVSAQTPRIEIAEEEAMPSSSASTTSEAVRASAPVLTQYEARQDRTSAKPDENNAPSRFCTLV